MVRTSFPQVQDERGLRVAANYAHDLSNWSTGEEMERGYGARCRGRREDDEGDMPEEMDGFDRIECIS